MSKITKHPSRKSHQVVVLSGEDIDLRRWCIEQALKWPQAYQSYSAAAGAYPYQPPQPPSPDIIGRAEAIRKWVAGSK